MKKVAFIDNLQPQKLTEFFSGKNKSTEYFSMALGGNSGNVAYVYGAKKIIQNEMVRVDWGTDSDYLRSNFDSIVVACANQIGAHVDLRQWGNKLKEVNLPVVLLGLGAQTTNYETTIDIPEGSKYFLSVVDGLKFGSGSNIAARGEFTRKVLGNLGYEAVPLGCPSLFINPNPDLGHQILAESRDCVQNDSAKYVIAAGNPFHLVNRKYESRLIEFCERFDGAYVVQHPDGMIALTLNDENYNLEKLSLISSLLGFSDVSICKQWFSKYAHIFSDSDEWMRLFQRYSGVIGARYHGVALAIQAKRPGLVLTIDNRTMELSQSTAIPFCDINEINQLTSEEIANKIRWTESVAYNFDMNRRQKARIASEFLTDNDLVCGEDLEKIAR